MDDRIKFITDIDTLVKLRFDYISTEIELSAEDREAYEANAPTYLSSVFYILFFAYGVRLRAHRKIAALGLALSAVVTIILRFKDPTIFLINKLSNL